MQRLFCVFFCIENYKVPCSEPVVSLLRDRVTVSLLSACHGNAVGLLLAHSAFSGPIISRYGLEVGILSAYTFCSRQPVIVSLYLFEILCMILLLTRCTVNIHSHLF